MVLFPSGGYWLLTKPPTMIRLFAELFGRYQYVKRNSYLLSAVGNVPACTNTI
jgi:hypothetical protein